MLRTYGTPNLFCGFFYQGLTPMGSVIGFNLMNERLLPPGIINYQLLAI
jgi:hypothetical protein